MTDLEAQLAQRGIHPRIISTLVEFAKTHPVVRCITESDGFRFSLDPHYHAGVYPNRGYMDIPLDPAAARSAAARHGLEARPKNPSTTYVRVPAGYLDTEGGETVTLELLDAAWIKVAAEPPWNLRDEKQPGSWGDECPNCNLPISKVTGVCDDCGWTRTG
jgi:hypothetical protein